MQPVEVTFSYIKAAMKRNRKWIEQNDCTADALALFADEIDSVHAIACFKAAGYTV
jgi:hypothetical protein